MGNANGVRAKKVIALITEGELCQLGTSDSFKLIELQLMTNKCNDTVGQAFRFVLELGRRSSRRCVIYCEK